ncbi:cytochrome c [Pseudoxanthomonas taiwanensis]|jgi:mono/diheme cytochrome c family protein|nr:cytochrome c [Pseudoxanthomonas taiwanensis]
MRTSSLLLLAAMLSFSAVATGGEEPQQQPPAQPDMAAFARGAKAWADNCARCHNMRDPKDLSDDQWKVVTTHMRLRAGLDGREVRDITVFLQGSN